MRITNNIILHNTTGNINGNKVNVNNLNNQMTSQKKIQRPSENPVIAVRSLRLRTTLSEIDQYYENNIPDAESWMKVTETALANMKTILTDIRTQCTYGASDQITADDRKTILTQLEKLRDQVYAEEMQIMQDVPFYRLPHESEADLYDRRQYDILQYHTGTFL